MDGRRRQPAGPRAGVDSYSYHRLLGEVRSGEDPVAQRWTTSDVLDEVRSLEVGFVSLETCFLDPHGDRALVRSAAEEGLGVGLAWGHRDGLRFGADPAALDEAVTWIRRAPDWGASIVRVVAASPWVPRPDPAELLARTADALGELVTTAHAEGVSLALENHADLTLSEMTTPVERVPGLRLCLDTANALRVGDDPVATARALRDTVAMVHLKDVDRSTWEGPTGPTSVAYGAGVIDVEAVLAVLLDGGFVGPVCVELGHLGPGAVDERALVSWCLDWLSPRLAATR